PRRQRTSLTPSGSRAADPPSAPPPPPVTRPVASAGASGCIAGKPAPTALPRPAAAQYPPRPATQRRRLFPPPAAAPAGLPRKYPAHSLIKAGAPAATTT